MERRTSLAGKIATSFASTTTPELALRPAAGVAVVMTLDEIRLERSSSALAAVARRYFAYRWTEPRTPGTNAEALLLAAATPR
jgi:hypothetical protein